MTGAEVADRLRKALAEAGYPDAKITMEGEGVEDVGCLMGAPEHVPEEVLWRAWQVIGLETSCRACYVDRDPEECEEPSSLAHPVDDCGREWDTRLQAVSGRW